MHVVKELDVSVDKFFINYANIKVQKSLEKSFTIYNNESYAVDYVIEMIKEHGHVRSWHVDLLSGSIPPKSTVTRQVQFKPEFDRVYESSLKVIYTNTPHKYEQSLFLRGEGYDLIEKIILCEGGIERILQAGEKAKELLDVGRLVLGEEKKTQITIENNGRYPFDFAWNILGLSTKILTISPISGQVRPNETILCTLKFHSLVQLKDRRITGLLTIDKEKKYPIHISTFFTRSRIDLSDVTIDFGLNYLHLNETSRVLRITNRERRDIILESTLLNPAFKSSLKFHTLAEGDFLDVFIYFHPDSRTEYKDTLVVKVDEHSEYRVPITGAGIYHDLQTLDVKDNVVDFGSMKSGSSYTKKLRIKNNSALPISLQIADKDTLTRLLQLGCKISPERIVMKSKEVVPINFVFSPKGRLGNIAESLLIYTNDTIVKELNITGLCQGIELHLSESSLFLGPTLPNVAVYKTIILENIGEIGSKFVWDTSKFNGIFSMDPKEGYISPKASVSLKYYHH